jgi:hypothetical protein
MGCLHLRDLRRRVRLLKFWTTNSTIPSKTSSPVNLRKKLEVSSYELFSLIRLVHHGSRNRLARERVIMSLLDSFINGGFSKQSPSMSISYET